MNSVNKVKLKLNSTDITCAAILKNGEMYVSSKHGIAPIMDQLKENQKFFQDSIVGDIVIGKAAALLLVKAGISHLYAKLISEYAFEILEQNRISVEYEKKVPYIKNRTGDGMCPMEETVLKTDDPEEAYTLLINKLGGMKKM